MVSIIMVASNPTASYVISSYSNVRLQQPKSIQLPLQVSMDEVHDSIPLKTLPLNSEEKESLDNKNDEQFMMDKMKTETFDESKIVETPIQSATEISFDDSEKITTSEPDNDATTVTNDDEV
jgi:hypothetical protein